MKPHVRIERRSRTDVSDILRPFSEVFITTRGGVFYSRLFHTLDDTPHARAAQLQDFYVRQKQEMV